MHFKLKQLRIAVESLDESLIENFNSSEEITDLL